MSQIMWAIKGPDGEIITGCVAESEDGAWESATLLCAHEKGFKESVESHENLGFSAVKVEVREVEG